MPAIRLSRVITLTAALALAGCTIATHTGEAVEDLREDVRARMAGRSPVAGVGIVGTVTGAPAEGLQVNGLTVGTTPETLLGGGFGPAGPLEGAPIPAGHVVEIAAVRDAGRLVAREIEPIFALAGPVEAIDPAERELVVMGADVVVPRDAVLPPAGLAAIRPGQRVAISGLWRGETLVASRIDPQIGKGLDAVVSGVVSPLPGARYRIGGVPLAAEWGRLRPGFFHVVSGTWVADALVVDQVRLGRRVIGRWPAEALVIEAYGQARDFAGYHSGYPGPDRDGYYAGYSFVGREGVLGEDPAWRDYFVEVGGLGRPVDARDEEVEIVRDLRALFVGEHEGDFGGESEESLPGEYEDRFQGEFDIEYIIPIPEATGARRGVLEAIGNPLDPVRGALYVD